MVTSRCFEKKSDRSQPKKPEKTEDIGGTGEGYRVE